MINLNLKNAIDVKQIPNYQAQITKIHNQIVNYELEGNEFLGWIDLPLNSNSEEIKNIQTHAKKLREKKVEVLVVVGIGGSFLGAKAGYDFLGGEYKMPPGLELVFVGNSISGIDLAQKLEYVGSKSFAINVISKSGKTFEPALSFRLFYKLLVEKYGVKQADKQVYVTTDANRGLLLTQARQKDWVRFVIPDNVGGRFSVLTAVGLFPLACAGYKILEILEGAREGYKIYSDSSLQKNDAYRYALTRFLLSQKYGVELLVAYEPKFAYFCEWWKQLFGESEGKMKRGIFPASAIFSRDLHSLGQFIQEGSPILFETVITLQEPSLDVRMFSMLDNGDDLNFLDGKNVSDLNQIFFKSVTEAHSTVGKVPNVHIEIETDDEFHFGQLVYFFERTVTMSAYLIGVNPFNQPGVEIYKSNALKKMAELREEDEQF